MLLVTKGPRNLMRVFPSADEIERDAGAASSKEASRIRTT